MLFQSLDDKKECVAIFLDGHFIKDIPKNLSQTWNYSASLKGLDIEYANLYCGGKTLDEVCPEHLREEWDKINGRMRAYHRSFVEAKISLNDNCFFDLVPEQFLLQYCDVKNQITKHILKNYEKPENCDFLAELSAFTAEIRHNHLNIDLNYLKSRLSEYKVRQFYKKINKVDPYIKYDIFGTKTGRLTTRKNSFPILTMDKRYRGVLKPNNDWFVELDYNAAELRTMLALLGERQPIEDIHDWNIQNVYNNEVDRDEAKKRIFSWLYNPNSKDDLLKQVYDRDSIKDKYWDGEYVNTIYGRKIESDEYHAVNYIIQSTFSDLLLKQAIKINKLLEGTKTHVAFTIHDSIVLDMAHEDETMINEIYHQFADTEFGPFKTSAKAGKNFGELKELWIKY